MPILRLFLLWCLATAALSQEPEVMPPPADVVKNVETLRELVPALQEAEKELAAIRAELAKATTDEAKADLTERVNDQRDSVRQLRANLRIVASGVEDAVYQGVAAGNSTLDGELRELMKPLMDGLREATAKPREMEVLRSELRKWRDRLALATAAVERIDGALAANDDAGVGKELQSARKLWASRQSEARSQTETLGRQIEEREKTTPTAWEAISGMLSDFWRNRGMNLLLAFGSAVAVLILSRRLYHWGRRFSPLHRKRKGGLAARSMDLIAASGGALLAFVSIILVFYLRGDWLMLAISLIFLVGLLWASKTALPPYVEQIKVILNLGPVRQGERLVHEGIPWRVDALNMYCDFSNPELTGGTMRLPVKDLLSLHSRPADPKEPWFPTRENDWVLLADGCFGKVIQQTPEQVVVLRLGSSLKTYPTSDFLELRPENVSRGFRISTVFGIGYGHRAEATTNIAQILEHAVRQRLVETLGREAVRTVKAEFRAAGASSLDYSIFADFDGDVAQRHGAMERLMQAACVDACNANGWDIPFPQMVIHQG